MWQSPAVGNLRVSLPRRDLPEKGYEMAVTEERRHRLYTKLERLIGEEDASTMMELVPPVGWGDVATKRDLDRGLDSFANRLRAEWSRQLIAMVIAIVTANAATTALIVSVAGLSG